MAVIVYDLDHTLIDHDCSQLWLQYLTDTGIAGEETIAEADRQHQQYLNAELDMNDYLALVLGCHTGKTVDEATAGIDHFIEHYVVPHIRSEAVANIHQHQAKGDRCVVISASVEFLVAPIARYLGIEDAIGVRIDLEGGLITGKGTGVVCYQEGKVFYFREWLEQNSETAEGSWFYSDSHNDTPLLEVVDNAVAVTPDEKLLALSEQRGWQVVYW